MFHLVSSWTLPAPAARVWEVMAAVERWPAWWPGVTAATVVRAAGSDLLGQRTHVVVRSPIGYALRFGVEVTAAAPPTWAAARVVGDLRGQGWWSAVEHDGGTLATVHWHVEAAAGPVRTLAALAPGPARWAHGAVMHRGEAALRRQLSL